jgi:ribonucleotide monophosphatase NagD (HAD superfamily)
MWLIGLSLWLYRRSEISPAQRHRWQQRGRAPCGSGAATGAILAAIEKAGGAPAVVVGKPEQIMFDIAREALTGCTRIGVLGDHLTADIQGAKSASLDAILVLGGATTQVDLERAPIPPDLVLDSLAALPAAIRVRS